MQFSKFKILSVLCLFVLGSCSSSNAVTSKISRTFGSAPKAEGRYKVGNPYVIDGKRYTPKEDFNLVETGIASWYGPNFHGKMTANGEIFDQNELTAAHRTLQMPSLVRVTNLENGRSVVVRVNDRGPFSRGRIIDMSKRGAELLGFKNKGTAKVRVEVLTQESLAMAEAAKRGRDTSGIETAMNEKSKSIKQQPIKPVKTAQAAPTQLTTTEQLNNQSLSHISSGSSQQSPYAGTASLKPVEAAPLSDSPVPLHRNHGQLYPDPVVRTVPVAPTNIFVQAGSFSQESNANALAQKLSNFGPVKVYPSMVNGKQFYRVRLMARDVGHADNILGGLANAGNTNAIIVVE